MTLSKLLFLSLSLLFISSCTRIHYVGNTYAPTTDIKLVFEKRAITEPYEIIGHVLGEGSNMKVVQKKMIKRAMEEGADAILIENLNLDNSANGNNVYVTTPASQNVNVAFPVVSTGSTYLRNQVRGSFIRYK